MESVTEGPSSVSRDSSIPLPGRVTNSMGLCKWWARVLPLGNALGGTFDPR